MDIEKIIKVSVEKLLSKDSFLLKSDVNERTITHRLAIYLEECFSDWNVDCEYNRDRFDTKKLDLFKVRLNSDILKLVTVYPDIIVHKRGTKDNLLVIEVKKSSNKNEDTIKFDNLKLKEYKRQLGYQYTFFIEIGTKNDIGEYKISEINTPI